MQASTEELLDAFWRMARTFKTSHTGPLEPALLAVLHVIACERPGRLSDLATHLRLDLSTVSRHVRALEDAGYLERTADPDDRRATQISITAKGEQIFKAARAARAEQFERVLAHWSDQDRQTFERLLGRLADDLEKDTVGTNA